MNTENTQRLRANPQVVFTKFDDGTGVLLHLEHCFYYTLNESALLAWNQIERDGTVNCEQLTSALSDEFDVTPTQARDDLKSLVASLRDEGLLVPV